MARGSATNGGGSSKTGTQRKRQPVAAAQVDSDPNLDDVVANRLDMVPAECAPCNFTHPDDAPVFYCGEIAEGRSKMNQKEKDDLEEALGAFGWPNPSNEGKVAQWKVQEMWMDKSGKLHSRQSAARCVVYCHDLVDPKLFESPYAVSKWPDEDDRNAEKLKWNIAIWKDRTGQDDIPAPGSSTYKKQNAAGNAEIAKAANAGEDTADKNDDNADLPKSGNMPDPELVKLKALYEKWLKGDLPDIDQDNVQKRLTKAFQRFFLSRNEKKDKKDMKTPPKEVLIAAYQERKNMGAVDSCGTQAWVDWEEEVYQTGRKMTVLYEPMKRTGASTEPASAEDEFDDPEYWGRQMRDPLEPIPSYEEACAFIDECERRGEDYSKANRTKVLAAFDVICWDRFGWLE